MAADLEIRPSADVVKTADSDHHRTTGTTPLDHVDAGSAKINEEEDQVCHTPRSPHHMIPAALSCPPAPKKRRLAAPVCKRRLFDLPFFEKSARDEVESLFGSTVQVNLNGSIKRKCIA